MSVFFISDLHFGHRNMAIKRGFPSEIEHDEFIISQWNKTVNKKDMVYILGDITMEKKTYGILDKLNGLKNVVLGNHDARNHVPELLKHVNSVAGMVDYKNKCILTHCPIHPQELGYRFRYNIHGHVHEKPIYRKLFGLKLFRDRRYVNVSCEALNYTPIEFEKLIKQQ